MRLGDLSLSRLTAATAAAALALTLAACSGEEGEDDGPEASASASATVAVEPGPELEAGAVTINAPEGFEVQEQRKKNSPAVVAAGPAGSLVSIVELDFPNEAPALDRQAETALTGLGEDFTIEDDVQVDGVDMWHISGQEGDGPFTHVYGAIQDGTAVRLTVRLSGDEYSAEEREAVLQQMMDSWTWNA